jgi:glycosyltransferase involved in cell wall biosynthesis
MRILHLDSGREMRGGQWQVLRLIEGLLADGVDCTLLARNGGPLFDAARGKGWRVQPLGIASVVRLARRHDLVHAHDARSHTYAAVSAGAPLIVARRVAFPVRSAWKYRRAARYIAVSKFVRSVLCQGGVPEEKITVIYDGVPLMEPARGSALLALSNADDSQKGAGLASEAAKLAGVSLRWTTDLEKDLHDATALVYLTYSEGLGSAALLAMSAGVPVVASRVGGLPEVITDGENGFLVENSAAVIAEVIGNLTGSPGLAARLGQAARQTVQENFTADRMVRRTMEVYRQVLS